MKTIIKNLPIIGKIIHQRNILLEERNNLKNELNQLKKLPNYLYGVYPPGHFYSPIPSIDTINNYHRLKKIKLTINGINLNINKQLSMVKKFKMYLDDFRFPENKSKNYRYYLKNSNYSYGDAFTLYSFIRFLKPKRIIEIGSGYSSALMLDVSEIFFRNKIEIIFIEPFPELFISLIKESDLKQNLLIKKDLQNVDIKIFQGLRKNDILFIDSTHVSKLESDVNYIFFDILPTLKKGVYVHFHDVFFPFDYPEDWLKQGLFWNESYLLRAFLSFNNSFDIQFFNNFLFEINSKILLKYLPIYAKNPGGSIWLKKIK